MPQAFTRIFPLGDSALTVEFGAAISLELNSLALSIAARLDRNPFPGYIESVPAYASTTVFYDPVTVLRHFDNGMTAFETVREIVERSAVDLDADQPASSRIVELPISFDPDAAPDLDTIALNAGLSTSASIEIFLSVEYRVYMLGFLPGFAYMGEVDERLSIGRKATPRSLVPKGSVGIAGRQTGIYSLDSPGGWQIIGRTDVETFTPNAAEPCLLRPGDTVRFVRAE